MAKGAGKGEFVCIKGNHCDGKRHIQGSSGLVVIGELSARPISGYPCESTTRYDGFRPPNTGKSKKILTIGTGVTPCLKLMALLSRRLEFIISVYSPRRSPLSSLFSLSHRKRLFPFLLSCLQFYHRIMMHVLCFLLIIAISPLCKADNTPEGTFINPPQSLHGEPSFDSNPVWTIGETQTVKWTTTYTNYTITLWQQSGHSDASEGPSIFRTVTPLRSPFIYVLS